MQLTTHFTLAELTASQSAARLGIDNTPSDEVVLNLTDVARHLEEIRAYFCRPVIVSSGFRCEMLNRAIGGSLTSAHRYGLAADFTVQGVSNIEVCEFVRDHMPDVDQIIYEFGPSGWVHIGLAAKPRREALTAIKVSGRTVYKPGIVAV